MDREVAGVVAVKVSELLGLAVQSESGDRLGRVHDVRGELTSRTLRVTGLVVGELGLLERLGLGAPTAGERLRGRDVIAWKDVVRADRRGVVVRDAAKSG
jgi:sporulation protein YlmC with PRC-barrel domain